MDPSKTQSGRAPFWSVRFPRLKAKLRTIAQNEKPAHPRAQVFGGTLEEAAEAMRRMPPGRYVALELDMDGRLCVLCPTPWPTTTLPPLGTLMKDALPSGRICRLVGLALCYPPYEPKITRTTRPQSVKARRW